MIRELPPELIEKIAAGEVIENPSSVIKELVENSIDAKADIITCEVIDGGKKLIKVTDNGTGINKKDAQICFKRHTTSKISSFDDLFSIYTLGFRGEALASIGTVSNMQIITRNKDENIGTLIKIAYGKTKEISDSGTSVGTSVIVKNLFFNVPARMKFLRSSSSEFNKILDVILKYSIVQNNIKFQLIHNGRTVMSENKSDIFHRICSLLKIKTQDITEIDVKEENLHIKGIVSKPIINKPSRNMQYVFVNGRPVYDRIILHAINSAYENIIMKDRFPIAVLLLQINPKLVDFNVHPTKKEVKFSNSQNIHDKIKNIIRDKVKGEVPKHYINISTPPSYGQTSASYYHKETKTQESFEKYEVSGILGQFKNTYIIAEWENKLAIIDQHAAHERIIYEKLNENNKSLTEKQGLLLPQVLEFTVKETKIIEESYKELEKVGFEINKIGNNEFAIHSIPVALKGKNVKEIIEGIVNSIMESSKASAFERILKTIACRSAVMAGQFMENTQISKLITDLKICKTNYCPHGRPVIVILTAPEIAKLFKRP